MPRTAGLGLAAVLVLVAGWFLWPAALGGGTTYLGTEGVSMQPLVHAGDLAVLREADDYAVGDVVGYRSETLGTTVLHRITRSDAGAFTTRGDNNSWEDPDHPRADQVIGRLWLAVPHVGSLLPTLRSPWTLTALGMVAIVVSGSLGATSRRGRRALPVPTAVRDQARQVATAAGVVAVVAAAGGVAAFLAPATHAVAAGTDATVRGNYSYEGSARTGITYPDGRLATGDPVWLQLADDLTVSLHQSVEGPGATATGTLQLALSVATPDGWSAPLVSGPAAAVVDGEATASVPVDLAAAGDLARRHYAEVGAGSGGAVLTVTPVADVTGTVDGRPFAATALAPLTFDLGDDVLTMSGDAAPTATVPVAGSAVAPTTVPVLGTAVPLGVLRGIACLALAAALVVAVAARAVAAREGRDDTAAVLLRHRDRVLPVTAVPAGPVVEVPTVSALARLAERLDAVILHHERPQGPAFLVHDGATTYRFEPEPAAAEVPAGRHAAPGLRAVPRLAGLLGRLALI